VIGQNHFEMAPLGQGLLAATFIAPNRPLSSSLSYQQTGSCALFEAVQADTRRT
jgi:hypothetical protein